MVVIKKEKMMMITFMVKLIEIIYQVVEITVKKKVTIQIQHMEIIKKEKVMMIIIFTVK